MTVPPTRRGRASGDPDQLQIVWTRPPAEMASRPVPAVPNVRPDGPRPLVQRLRWDFRSSFPEPTPEAIEAGILADEDVELENLRALHAEHGRQSLAVLEQLEVVHDARRRGVDPETGTLPRTAAARERLSRRLADEPARLERWWNTLMDTYESGFGPEAADAFGKALRAWHAGIDVVADDTRRPTPEPAAIAELAPARRDTSRPRDSARIVARLPVPRPLPTAVDAGRFGRDGDGCPIRPSSCEVREITEQHAEKLIGLLSRDARSVPDPERLHIQEAFRSGIAAYAEDFGTRSAEQLEAYVRRQAGRDTGVRRGR